MSLVVGIDPGAEGAIAWLQDGQLIAVEDLPIDVVTVGKSKRRRLNAVALTNMLTVRTLRANLPNLVMLEEVGAMPGEGSVGAFSFGRCAGLIEGVVAGLGIPHRLVKPADWKRAMGVTADKTMCRVIAGRLFPHKADAFVRVRDDGRAEAALLALYGHQQGAKEWR